ncbi:MAG: sigma-54-dependent Fis family transcriptional regulator [Proteobacteria bacterium]|nr:MAG: sigma-54-dependent Fis family transcriptional regulator [Pseudomonadota bacterium]
MDRIRSILFVGRAETLRSEGVAESPLLDVAWARDAEDAAALPLSAFDAIVLDADADRPAREAVARLRQAGRGACPPILVRLPATSATSSVVLRSAGATAVCARGEADGASLRDLLAAVVPPAPIRTPADGVAGRRLLARSAPMRDVLALVERATASHATVLLTGETGTGKEVLARAIHDGSPRRRGAFVAVNCAAFPETLLESELFGHVKGAFTGADRSQPGLFEAADGGTLFLDEIGETSPSLQAKLLRALQEREVRPVGGAKARKVDVRVVAATNRTLGEEVARGRFREDLYYRLAVFRINVPPLRARADDVVPLAEHFLRLHGEREAKPGCHLSRAAADLLLAYHWPGNVRELENEMQHALALAESGESIAQRHLSERLQGALRPVQESTAHEGPQTLRAQVARVEAWLIRRALDAHGNRRAATARTLGLTREGLYK